MIPQDPSIEVSLVIDAPVDRVFKAWTDPELLAQWQTQKASVEPRAGGAFRYETDDVDEMPGLHVVTGTYLEFIPNEKLVAEWHYQSPDADEEPIDSIVTTLFKALGDDQTELTVIEQSDTHEDDEEADFSIEAWANALEELADLLAEDD